MFNAAEPAPSGFTFVPGAAAGTGVLLGAGTPTPILFATDSSVSITPLGTFVRASMVAYCARSPPGAPTSFDARAWNDASAAPLLVAVAAGGTEVVLPLLTVRRAPVDGCPALLFSAFFTYNFSVAPAAIAYCARAPPLMVVACPPCLPLDPRTYQVARMVGAAAVEACIPAGRMPEGIALNLDTRVELSSASTTLTPVLRATLLPAGMGGAVLPGRGGNVTLTSLSSIGVLMMVPSPPSLLNVAALVGAFVLSSISAVGKVLSVIFSPAVAARAACVAAAVRGPLLLRALLAASAIAFPVLIGLAPSDFLAHDSTIYVAFCVLSSSAVLARVAIAWGVVTALDAVARVRAAAMMTCAASSAAAMISAFVLAQVRVVPIPAGASQAAVLANALAECVSILSVPGVVAAVLLALLVYERTAARGQGMLASNVGSAAVSLLWLWGALISSIACVAVTSCVRCVPHWCARTQVRGNDDDHEGRGRRGDIVWDGPAA